MSLAVRVLVVDDSALVRQRVSRLLEEDPGLKVVGTASNGVEALREADRLAPDVVTLDVTMPVMDGLACLSQLVRRHRQRVVLLSTLAHEGSFTTYKALALGAVDFVSKPGTDSACDSAEALGRELRRKVWAAAGVPAGRIGTGVGLRASAMREPGPKPAPRCREGAEQRELLRVLIGVGGSTGGVVALETLLREVPPGLPAAVLAVQHLPLGFSAGFARYLDSVSQIRVKEGEDGEEVLPGRAYIAPGGSHLRVQAAQARHVLRVDGAGPADDGFRPSINALLCSAATACRERAVGVLLSGMGSDGAVGLAAIRKLGGRTFAQDEGTSVVYGMAAEAVRRGAVDCVLPLEGLGRAVIRAAERGA